MDNKKIKGKLKEDPNSILLPKKKIRVREYGADKKK